MDKLEQISLSLYSIRMISVNANLLNGLSVPATLNVIDILTRKDIIEWISTWNAKNAIPEDQIPIEEKIELNSCCLILMMN